jgi:DNA end-binding protein Ku
MAKTLIRSMAKPFEPGLYKDEYQNRLRDLIQKKIAGKEIVAAKEEAPSNVIDLMEALRRSIEQSQGAGAAGRNQEAGAGRHDQGGAAAGQNWTPAVKSPPGA